MPSDVASTSTFSASIAREDEEDAPQKKQAQMPPPSSMTAWGKKGKNQPGGAPRRRCSLL